MYHKKDYLTCIGSGASGFFLADDCNINTKSRSYLEWEEYYELPLKIKPGSNEA